MTKITPGMPYLVFRNTARPRRRLKYALLCILVILVLVLVFLELTVDPKKKSKPSPSMSSDLSSLPQIYVGGNKPDQMGSGFTGVGRPAPKMPSVPNARKMLDKARSVGEDRPLLRQRMI